MNTRKTVLVALMACLALGIYALESIVPPIVPVPGVKLGLANVVTLVAIYVLGCRAAFATLLIRIVLSSLLFGQVMSFWFSLAGGVLCWAAMCIASKYFDTSQVWIVSVFGALFHSAGQTLVAIAVTSQLAVAYYFLFLIISSIISGIFTGICASYCIKFLKNKIL